MGKINHFLFLIRRLTVRQRFATIAAMTTIILKLSGSPRYKTPNFREKRLRNVTVDSEGRVYLFDEQASPLTVDECFHFFEEALNRDDWEVSAPSTSCRKRDGARTSQGACDAMKTI